MLTAVSFHSKIKGEEKSSINFNFSFCDLEFSMSSLYELYSREIVLSSCCDLIHKACLSIKEKYAFWEILFLLFVMAWEKLKIFEELSYLAGSILSQLRGLFKSFSPISI